MKFGHLSAKTITDGRLLKAKWAFVDSLLATQKQTQLTLDSWCRAAAVVLCTSRSEEVR